MATILETLQNAQYNLIESRSEISPAFGKEQLHNAITLLEKGYSVNTEIEPILAKYENIEDAPNIE